MTVPISAVPGTAKYGGNFLAEIKYGGTFLAAMKHGGTSLALMKYLSIMLQKHKNWP